MKFTNTPTRKVYMRNYSDNYLNIGLITYPPELKTYRTIQMLSQEDEKEISKNTSDSAARLYRYYIDKRGWKHFNPLDYEKIGKDLGWTARKAETQKAKLQNAGYLLTIKDTLNDGTKLYRVLLGRNIVSHYNKTGEYPELTGVIEQDLSDIIGTK